MNIYKKGICELKEYKFILFIEEKYQEKEGTYDYIPAFNNPQDQHRYWLGIQLGHYPDPNISTKDWDDYWEVLEEVASEGKENQQKYCRSKKEIVEEEADDCCHSGCPGCPNYS